MLGLLDLLWFLAAGGELFLAGLDRGALALGDEERLDFLCAERLWREADGLLAELLDTFLTAPELFDLPLAFPFWANAGEQSNASIKTDTINNLFCFAVNMIHLLSEYVLFVS